MDRTIKFLFLPRTISFATIYYIILFHYSNRITIHDDGDGGIEGNSSAAPQRVSVVDSYDREIEENRTTTAKLDHILITFDDRSP